MASAISRLEAPARTSMPTLVFVTRKYSSSGDGEPDAR